MVGARVRLSTVLHRHAHEVESFDGGYTMYAQVAISMITPERLDALRRFEESQKGVLGETDASVAQLHSRGTATDKLSASYESLVEAFIRPPRHHYTLADLGEDKFLLPAASGTEEHLCFRTDLELPNRWGDALQCSWYQREDLREQQHPCVVYLHANSGSRVNAKQAVRALLPLGISVFCFDFGGSGLSGGQYVTLGLREHRDVDSVLRYLRGTGRVSRVGLWGRSMGAVAGLMHARQDPRVAALVRALLGDKEEESCSVTCIAQVCDSPFADLPQLCEEIVTQSRRGAGHRPSRMPSFLVRGALMIVAQSIESRCDLNIYEVTPVKDVAVMTTPVMFVHGVLDDMVSIHHSQGAFALRYRARPRLSCIRARACPPRSVRGVRHERQGVREDRGPESQQQQASHCVVADCWLPEPEAARQGRW